MKKMKLLTLLGILVTGFTFPSKAQETLPEVTVVARNYKYLKAVDNKEAAQPVRLLEHKAAAYDIRNSDLYDDDYESYSISFYLPDGYILAVYDASGKLLRTAEKFKNVALPPAVRDAVNTRFPKWSISNDTYLVNYKDAAGSKKQYKLVLYNGNKKMRIRASEDGEIMD